MQQIMEASEDIQMEVPNEYLIGSLKQNDEGYFTADVIIYNKVVRLKLTETKSSAAKHYLCKVMPLFQGDSPQVIQMNIRKLIDEGYSPLQAVAIANAEAAKFKKR